MSRGNASRPCQTAIPRAPRTVSSSGEPRAMSSGAESVSLATGGRSGSRPWTSCRTWWNAPPGSVLASHRTVLAPGKPSHVEEPGTDVQGPALRSSGALPRLSREHRCVARFSRPGSRKATTDGWAIGKKPSERAQPALAATSVWGADCGHDQRRLCSPEKRPLRWLGIPPAPRTI